ncbi:pseudouridine synthase [Sungkyunkwania multivorans]|uniref:Pseudouridine synthase n=1 Tax=Sungkyunkwania multivorans TaxID=1173618 RepID=A0ABW3CWI7_9FLAO
MSKVIHSHYKIYKPFGFLSQFVNNEQRQGKRKMLGDLYDFPEGLMAIGRLDKQSEGLLLLTTDGKLSQRIRSKFIEKEYYVQVDGAITSEAIRHLETGVTITVDGAPYLTRPAKAVKLGNTPVLPARGKKIRDDRHGPTSWISITITEGKFRQVRKMTSAAGFPTLRLVRYRIGEETIDGMVSGEVVQISSMKC